MLRSFLLAPARWHAISICFFHDARGHGLLFDPHRRLDFLLHGALPPHFADPGRGVHEGRQHVASRVRLDRRTLGDFARLLRMGCTHLFRRGAPARRLGAVLRHRQTVDVEDRAPQRAATKSTSYTFPAAKPSAQAHVGRVVHSFFLPAMRIKQTPSPVVHDAVVQRRHAGYVPSLLRGVLRHRTFAHGRSHHRHGARRIRALDRRRRHRGGIRCCFRRRTLRCQSMQHLSSPRHHGARADAVGSLWARPCAWRADKPAVADDNYVRESILNPGAKSSPDTSRSCPPTAVS